MAAKEIPSSSPRKVSFSSTLSALPLRRFTCDMHEQNWIKPSDHDE